MFRHVIAWVALAGSARPTSRPLDLPKVAEYRQVSSFSALPAGAQEACLAFFSRLETGAPGELGRPTKRAMLIAEPNEPFQATDLVEHGRPVRRLVFGGVGAEPFILYEHGGRGLHLHVLFLGRSGSACVVARNLVFTSGGSKPPSTIPQLWRALQRAPAHQVSDDDA